jgi:hypothetical protein
MKKLIKKPHDGEFFWWKIRWNIEREPWNNLDCKMSVDIENKFRNKVWGTLSKELWFNLNNGLTHKLWLKLHVGIKRAFMRELDRKLNEKID